MKWLLLVLIGVYVLGLPVAYFCYLALTPPGNYSRGQSIRSTLTWPLWLPRILLR